MVVFHTFLVHYGVMSDDLAGALDESSQILDDAIAQARSELAELEDRRRELITLRARTRRDRSNEADRVAAHEIRW